MKTLAVSVCSGREQAGGLLYRAKGPAIPTVASTPHIPFNLAGLELHPPQNYNPGTSPETRHQPVLSSATQFRSQHTEDSKYLLQK